MLITCAAMRFSCCFSVKMAAGRSLVQVHRSVLKRFSALISQAAQQRGGAMPTCAARDEQFAAQQLTRIASVDSVFSACWHAFLEGN
jgi:hypothetical protein